MTEDEKKREKGSYILRLMAGGYLLYLSYGLVTDILADQTVHRLGVTAAAGLFGIIGIGFIFTSVRYLYRDR